MNLLTRSVFFICIFAALSIFAAKAQSPKPIIVQAASAPTSVPAAAVAVPDNSASLQTAIKSLQEARAANSETLKKQEAVLEQLDEMQKNAAQLKIFAHRSGG
jgi:cell shape-determining protein MreC